jgi:cell division GTPase FtsZ
MFTHYEGRWLCSYGESEGRRARKKPKEAAKNAIFQPLLETSINGAKVCLSTLEARLILELNEIELAASMVR